MLPEPDRERLLHIRDATRKIRSFIEELSEDDFKRSDLVQHGVINCLYIIGEAASRVSQGTRNSFPEIEWDLIRGMRNRLAHAYFDINLDIVWYSATIDAPCLMSAIDNIIGSE